jgi:hypothetical protein
MVSSQLLLANEGQKVTLSYRFILALLLSLQGTWNYKDSNFSVRQLISFEREAQILRHFTDERYARPWQKHSGHVV